MRPSSLCAGFARDGVPCPDGYPDLFLGRLGLTVFSSFKFNLSCYFFCLVLSRWWFWVILSEFFMGLGRSHFSNYALPRQISSSK